MQSLTHSVAAIPYNQAYFIRARISSTLPRAESQKYLLSSSCRRDIANAEDLMHVGEVLLAAVMLAKNISEPQPVAKCSD